VRNACQFVKASVHVQFSGNAVMWQIQRFTDNDDAIQCDRPNLLCQNNAELALNATASSNRQLTKF